MSKLKRWIDSYNITEEEYNAVWFDKIKQIKDKKIAETNYKILHHILPCNQNLKRWKIKTVNTCDICNEIQDIAHLLFYCKYAKKIWKEAESILNIELSIENVIFGIDMSWVLNTVISLLCYFIYKEWLIHSLENNSRNHMYALKSFRYDFTFHHNVFKSMGAKFIPVTCILGEFCDYIVGE